MSLKLVCTIVIWKDPSGSWHQWDVYNRRKAYVVSMINLITNYAGQIDYIEEIYQY